MKISKLQLKQIVKEEVEKELKETVNTEVWSKVDRLREILGADLLVEELIRAMTTDEAEDNLNYIARNHDIHFNDEEFEPPTAEEFGSGEGIKEEAKVEKGKVVSREYKPEEGPKKVYKAIHGMKKYVKEEEKKEEELDEQKFELGKCIKDLEDKPEIDNPAAVCRAAEIAHTGEAHGTRTKKKGQ